MLSRKDENKEKEAGNGPLKKHEPTTWDKKSLQNKSRNKVLAAAYIIDKFNEEDLPLLRYLMSHLTLPSGQ